MEHVTGNNFAAEVLDAPGTVVVSFFSAECGLCRYLAPQLEKVAGEFAGRARFVRVDVDAEPDVAAACEVENLPTVMLFQAGELVETWVGDAVSAIRAKLQSES